jgi:hypothetical protein
MATAAPAGTFVDIDDFPDGRLEMRCKALPRLTRATSVSARSERQRCLRALDESFHVETRVDRRGQALGSHLVALRPTKVSASDPPSTWWPGER